MRGIFPIGAMLIIWSSVLLAQEKPLIEEIMVTAQRIEENAQKVPIALAAFNEAMIEDRQIIGLTDLHIRIPNVTFAPLTAASGADIRIRGVGVQDLGYGSEVPTSTHVNEIPFPQSFASVEFFDLERIEVMRGPQGTLFGRNATSGALNIVTRRPTFDNFGGYVDLEYGDYDNQRVTGALNVPLNDALAFRLAGTALKRDGYIKNKAGGQIPGVDRHTDGRDYHAIRATAQWQINDRASLWVMYDRFDEDSSKVTSSLGDCKQTALPILGGCEPNESGRDGRHPGAGGFGVLLGFQGIIPLGARNTATGLQFDFPRPALGRREVHEDGNNEWELEEDIWAFGFDWAFDQWTLGVKGGYQQSTWRRSQSDGPFNFSQVGFRLGPTNQNPSGLWPLSETAQGPDFLRGGQCDVDSYRAGVLGGCIEDWDQTRAVSRIVVGDEIDYLALEANLRSNFDGPVNFLLGANYSDRTVEGYVAFTSNVFDMFTTGVFGPRLYPGIFGREKDDDTESFAAFGEVYWQTTDSLKITLGLRYNEDEKRPKHAVFGFNSIDANGLLEPIFGPNLLGPEPQFVRSPLASYLFNFLFGVPVPDSAVALAEYYGAADGIAAATGLTELVDALQVVPPVERLGELRALAGRPAELKYREWSGRVVVDWVVRPDTMLYAKYNRGFKPGGFGLDELRDFDSEIVDSFEIGAKARLLDETLSLNAAIFAYKYHDLQVSPGAFQLEAENVDVDGLGFEFDGIWHPPSIPGLAINFSYGWLHTELQDYQEVDSADLRQGNPDYVTLNPFDTPFQGSYIAPIAEVLPLVDQALLEGGAIGEAFAPGTVYPNGIPAYFSRAYLEANGVATMDGFVVNAKGNQLPHSPEHSFGVGLAYSWFTSPGTVTARWDYYWQDTNYGSVFNSFIDKIDSWGQQNASLTFASAGGRWDAQLWIRNITNEFNVIAHNNRSLRIVGEPRIFGISVRLNFGNSET